MKNVSNLASKRRNRIKETTKKSILRYLLHEETILKRLDREQNETRSISRVRRHEYTQMTQRQHRILDYHNRNVNNGEIKANVYSTRRNAIETVKEN